MLARPGREQGVALCTLLFCSSANGYPINHISMAYEWVAWPVCTEAGFTERRNLNGDW